MITITGFVHRQEVSDIIRRWMVDDPHPADADRIARLVHFNTAYVSRYLFYFSNLVFSRLCHAEPVTRSVFRKGDLKDMLVADPPVWNPRIEALVDGYRQAPGLYYRETPFHGTLFFTRGTDRNQYLGSCRIKRVRRLAEKAARRIIDRIFVSIKEKADALADERAFRLGIPRQAMITAAKDMETEFKSAEARIIEDLRLGRPLAETGPLFIDDVAGLKVVLEEGEIQRFKQILGHLNCEVIEQQRHEGNYNDVSFLVRYSPPKAFLLERPLGDQITQVMATRGMPAEKTAAAFREFVQSGEETVVLEIITSSYEQMLESEIGRCMHEERIIDQRLKQEYNGQLARNIEYLVTYLFSFPASCRTTLEKLPIKLWHRYLPDCFDEAIRQLFDLPAIGIME
jgi:hypothetical protein